ncbi:hypothetical protein Mapa_007718 [Marchantia paleacea]|nr:hypothetical protein Mapa_007718 [Marchantia paleacea]
MNVDRFMQKAQWFIQCYLVGQPWRRNEKRIDSRERGRSEQRSARQRESLICCILLGTRSRSCFFSVH